MPRLLDYFAPAYAWLYALDPAFPQALFVSLVFFTVWLLRKLAPNQWEAFANLIYVKADDLVWWQNELRAAWQALPAAIIGTLYGLLGTGADPGPTLKAMALSLIAPVAHRLMARYKGQIGQPKTPGGPGEKPVGTAGEARDWTDVATPETANAPLTALQRRRRAPRLVSAFAFVLVGCGTLLPAKPPCDESKLRAIDADYGAKVLAVCLAKYPSKEACPEYPALKADHRRQLREECPQ